MENKKYLPIGTVVLLKDATKRIMIAGYCVTTIGETTKVWDYCGYRYPEGFGQKADLRMFDHSEIEKIVYLGLINEEEKAFADKIEEIYKQKKGMLINQLKNQKK